MLIRDAVAADAESACTVMRRSITELCAADHHDDPAILAAWLHNKTVENFTRWIARPDASVIVAVEHDAVIAVGGVTDAGEVTLNYVSPDARFRGVSTALLSALETRAEQRGASTVTLVSTVTAHRFYNARCYRDTGAPTMKFDRPGQPMMRHR